MNNHHAAYHLINDHSLPTPEEVKRYLPAVSGIGDDVLVGLSALGNMMHWAGAHEDYEGEQAKSDMSDIGLMLKHVIGFARGAELAESNLSHAWFNNKREANHEK